jgi:predicted metal-dependent hydrolase
MKLEFEGLCFEVRFRPVKYTRVEFKSVIPVVIVPPGTNPVHILRKKKQTILKKYAKMIEQLNRARDLPLASRGAADFEGLVNQLVKRFSNQLKVNHKRITFRTMKRRWGSCRSDGFITFNRCLQFLPQKLIEYIVFHELVHLLIPGHSKKFKNIIATQFPDFKALEIELKLYGHRLLL